MAAAASGTGLTVAIIPARGGSKGVPGKNLRRVGGVSLVERAVLVCLEAGRIDRVYVTTDDPDIAAAATHAGAEVITRPAALAGDTASSESALLHALDQVSQAGLEPQVMVFVQATSPFIDPATLDLGVELVLTDQADSVFSALPSHEFLWRNTTADGLPLVAGQNHDAAFRPRRQDRQPDYRETGAFYVMDVAGFRAREHRFFGRVAPVAVSALTAVDVDTLPELLMADAMSGLHPPLTSELDVDVVFTDFDGVHTDDSALVDQDSHETVRVSRSDGLGVRRLREAGVAMVIISTETNPVVRARAAKLKVEVQQGVDDKITAVRNWLEEHQIPAARAVYVGNDINDAAPMGLVGWPVAVADARPEILRISRLRLTRPGGHGAVRELCDLVVDQRLRRAARAAISEPGSAAGPSSGAASTEAGGEGAFELSWT